MRNRTAERIQEQRQERRERTLIYGDKQSQQNKHTNNNI